MTVTVSGMNVAGQTRALPKVIDWSCCGKAGSKGAADWRLSFTNYASLQAVRQDVAANIQQKAVKAVTAAKLKAVESILWGQKPSRNPSEQPFHCVLALLNGMTHAA